MTDVIDALLAAARWDALPCASGGSGHVPQVFRRLAAAKSAEEAIAAYWPLDNEVIVQGRLFPSAPALIPALGVALGRADVSEHARYWLLELLTELALGHGHEGLANPEDCRLQVLEEVARQSGQIFGLLDHSDPRVRRDALEILLQLDSERDRLRGVLRLLVADEDDRVRQLATQL